MSEYCKEHGYYNAKWRCLGCMAADMDALAVALSASDNSLAKAEARVARFRAALEDARAALAAGQPASRVAIIQHIDAALEGEEVSDE